MVSVPATVAAPAVTVIAVVPSVRLLAARDSSAWMRAFVGTAVIALGGLTCETVNGVPSGTTWVVKLQLVFMARPTRSRTPDTYTQYVVPAFSGDAGANRTVRRSTSTDGTPSTPTPVEHSCMATVEFVALSGMTRSLTRTCGTTLTGTSRPPLIGLKAVAVGLMVSTTVSTVKENVPGFVSGFPTRSVI